MSASLHTIFNGMKPCLKAFFGGIKVTVRFLIRSLHYLFPWHAKAWKAKSESIENFLNAKVNQAQNTGDLVTKWQVANQAQLSAIAVTSALLASVVASVFTWPTMAKPAWHVQTLFYVSLVMALGALGTATQQSVALGRLGSGAKSTDRICDLFESQRKRGIPSAWQLYIWQIPIWLLGTSLYFFVAALATLAWSVARTAGLSLAHGETKTATCLMVALAYVVLNYAASSLSIYGSFN